MKLRVAEIRRARGLSQEALGERIGLTGASISRIEQGIQSRTLARLDLLAEALGVTVGELFNAPVPDPKRTTYQDVLDAPEHMVAEILSGDLCLQPWQGVRHAVANSVLVGLLGGPFSLGKGGPGGWRLIFKPEVHLGDEVIVPDVAAWQRDRMPTVPHAAWFETPPDWVCEVLSPGTRQRDLTVKRAIYAEHGVAHLWFADPDARTLEAFALRGGEWVLAAALAGDAEVRLAPFDAVPFALGALWAD